MGIDEDIWIFVGIASALMFAGSLVALPLLIARAPTDFFTRAENAQRSLSVRVAQNLVAWILILVGIAMLVLPGQGMITLLLGLCLADLPGKTRVIHAILRNDSVWNGLSALRKRLGRAPFERPE